MTQPVTNKNFNSVIKPNMLTEQIEVLTAMLQEKPVYFYAWNNALTRMDVQKYVSKQVPDFNMWHFDTKGNKLRYKSPLLFQKGFVGDAISKVAVLYAGDEKHAQLNAWFEGDVLCVEPIKEANVRWMGSNPATAPAIPAAPPVTLPERKPAGDVTAIWERECARLKKQGKKFRSFTPQWNSYLERRGGNVPNYLHIPNSYELNKHPAYHVLIRFEKCVLVSQFAINRNEFVRWRLSHLARDNGINSQLQEMVTLNGHSFFVYWN